MSAPAERPWRPSASMSTLRLRAELLAQARAFFAARGVWEVDVPALVRCPVSDVHLHSAAVQVPGTNGTMFLHTSPEYCMKRLLAAGSGDIYQIAHVFRGEESGRWHNPEFTLIEWYRLGFTLQGLMEEVLALAALLLDLPASGAAQYLRYRDAFAQSLAVDPLETPVGALRTCAVRHGLDAPLAARLERRDLLDWLMGVVIGPTLGQHTPCFLYHYPADQAVLARLDPQAPSYAQRFELYVRGVELANGFEELADVGQQRARFCEDNLERERRALPTAALDEALLAALAHGLPPSAGVALGFDRIVMLRTGAMHIAEVLPFDVTRA